MKFLGSVFMIGMACWFFSGSVLILMREPIQPNAISTEDYPMDGGLKWTYVNSRGITLIREFERNVFFVPDSAANRVLHFRVPGIYEETLTMGRDPRGVIAHRGEVDQLIMKFPMVTGDSWTIDFPSYPEIAVCTVLGTERIRYLNENADAIKVEVVRTVRKSGKQYVDYEWYAPGIGLVKTDFTKGLRWSFTLTRFERPKGP